MTPRNFCFPTESFQTLVREGVLKIPRHRRTAGIMYIILIIITELFKKQTITLNVHFIKDRRAYTVYIYKLTF